jgi:hypothetical protein
MAQNRTLFSVALTLAAVWTACGQTPLTTQFAYQGLLEQGGVPADGLHDMRFRLLDAAAEGNALGLPICFDGVDVVDGLFSVDLDFGPAFEGHSRFLEISVRGDSTAGNCSNGAYTTLSPRQPIHVAPYAAFALATPTPHSLDASDGSPIGAVQVDAEGDVGIGLSPAAGEKLHVAGDARFDGLNGIGVRNPANPSAVVRLSWLNDVARIRWGGSGVGSANGFDFQKAGDLSLLRIQEDGKIGIGTATPANALHINANADIGPGMIGGSVRIGSATTFAMLLDVNEIQAANGAAAANLALNALGGDVGVGTTTPSAKLHVLGDARISDTLTVTAPAGDAAVQLPGDSISAPEILDEPGLASDQRVGSTTMTPAATVTLATRTITVPAAGYVLAQASAAVESGVIIGLCQPSLSISKDTSPTAESGGFTCALGSLDKNVISFHAVFAVSAGANTFTLSGLSFANNSNVSTRRLTLLYLPTAYGTVDVED